MDSADDPSGQVGNENISAIESDEANLTMNSPENKFGQLQINVRLSISSESEISSYTDDNLSEEVEQSNEDSTSRLLCNSENKIHTPTDDEAQASKHGMDLPECLHPGRNKKRALPEDDNEVEEGDAEEIKGPIAKKNRTDDQVGCMAASDEIVEEKNEFMQNICEESQNSAKDHDNEVKGDDAEGEAKSTAMNDRTDNESGCKAAEDEIMEEKNEFVQNIDEESLHLAEDRDNEVKEEDAEEEQNPTAKKNAADNQSGYMVAEDEIMQEKNESTQNTGEESQHYAENDDNEAKRDDTEEQQKPTAMENRTLDESSFKTVDESITEEENEFIENNDEESLHSAEDQEEAVLIPNSDENEDDLKDERGLDYDGGENDLERHNVPLKEVDILEPLTDKEEILVKLAHSEEYSNEVLVEHPNIDEDITGRLFECLRPEHRLNSDLVDVYLQLLKEREENNPKKFLKCHFFNSFFYESLARVFKTGDLESIMRKTRELEYQLIDCDKIFVPIYENGAHWVVISIDIRKKRIQYLNSILSEMNHQAMSIIAWYIEAEAKQRSGIDLGTDSWEKKAPENIPSQENENDSGVFMLKYIDFISRDLPLDFNQEDIPLFRKKIVIEILNMPGASTKIDLVWQTDDENATSESNESVKSCNILSSEDLLEPLNDVEKVIVQFALCKENRNLVLLKHPNISESVTRGLLQCLQPKRWLSSDIINVYLVVLKEREKNDPENFLKCHFFNTFFYTSLDRDLKTESITSIMRKTRRLEYELVNCDKIFVPINDNEDHWVVVVIDMQRKKIQYLDSLLGENRNAMKVIAWYIKEEAKQKSQIDLNTESWKMEFPKNIPRQQNNYDCGVFMLKYIDFLSRGLPMNFQQSHIPLFRKRLVLEILNIPGYSNKIKLE